MIRCAQCKVDIPAARSSADWGYKLGNNMFFCSYGCMRTKQADMDRKRSETMKRKVLEKEAREAKRKEQLNMSEQEKKTMEDEKQQLLEQLKQAKELLSMEQQHRTEYQQQLTAMEGQLVDSEVEIAALKKRCAALTGMLRDVLDMMTEDSK